MADSYAALHSFDRLVHCEHVIQDLYNKRLKKEGGIPEEDK